VTDDNLLFDDTVDSDGVRLSVDAKGAEVDCADEG
jgi:hypothetical protein